MSADSPRRAGVHKGAQVITPQPVSDTSIIDSVAGIINDIVPQAYTSNTPNSDNRESITWARFEYADVNDPVFYPDYNEGSSIPPLLLVLGYTTGVQVWLIAASGEATEVLSWRQGMVRTLRILPNPKCSEKERDDQFKLKRPMVAICDSAGPGPQFCSVSFISLKTGEQVKSIKFKSPVCDVLANKRSIAVTFTERIAVFDAKTLEDVLTITTCYLSPGPNPNPVALGTRWLAYSEKKLIPGRRSSGGSEGEGVSSYTATVLYAAKSLGKGLRGLGETVASSLTGNSVSPMNAVNNANIADSAQPGVVTILDLQAAKNEKEMDDGNVETVVAHFAAHSDAIVAMAFDQTGALLMTADKRGHDFHVFRIQPHPGGPSLAAVHHLYVLHRGDTTAKVQDMSFSSDARWAAISTVRGTTHVFPVAPYGGAVGVRTHSSPHVVNRLSRFHKSAGLTDDGARSHSPVSHAELPLPVYPYTNPRLPPYPHPTILHPLAQIRQPSSLSHVNNQVQPRVQQRQRLHSDESVTLPLKICACFAPPRAWIYTQRDSANKLTKRAIDSLFIMACHGNMIQYDLDPKPAAGVPKEKVCDETSIELEVEAKGQWPLLRTTSSSDIVPPLSPSSLLLGISVAPPNDQQLNSNESRWLSQVEIFTHAGPHRRLWMGPQFVFKTYNAPSGVAVNLVDAETVEIGLASGSRPARSNPVNMPHAASRPLLPLVIDGSGSSYEQSPRFVEAYGDALDQENIGVIGIGENQLREDLAEAMLETSSTPHRVAGRRLVVERVGHPIAKVVNPLGTVITVSADEEDASLIQQDGGGGHGDSYNDDDERYCSSSASSSSANVPTTSVCVLAGKWLEGKDSCLRELESQVLREHTEICAEMRPANEPAVIDSVPDDSIEELKERRSLCAEAASTATCCAVDLDRVGAFRDVPSSPSLCAERGAVPDCSNVLQIQQLRRVGATRDVAPERELDYQLLEVVGPGMSGAVPATATSSDEDLEHINSDELLVVAPRNAPSSDDDIEHVLHCDVSECNKRTGAVGRKRSKEKQRAAELTATVTAVVGASLEESKNVVQAKQERTLPQQQQPKKTRVRAKRQPVSGFNDMVEIINMDPVVVASSSEPLSPPPPCPPQPMAERFVEPLILPDMVEIINIDAEKESGRFPSVPPPDCKILLNRSDLAKKKSKRHKKQQKPPKPQTPQTSQIPQTPQLQQKLQSRMPPSPFASVHQYFLDNMEHFESPRKHLDNKSTEKADEEVQQTNNFWSSVVRRRSSSATKTEEARNAENDEEEANKENFNVSKRDNEENEGEQQMTVLKVWLSCKQDELEVEQVLEAKEEPPDEQSKKKCDFEQEAVSVLAVRSTSFDGLNYNDYDNVIVTMDTEEESCKEANAAGGQLLSALSEQTVRNNSLMMPVSALQAGVLPSKKANRSKKKKRR